MLSIHTALIVGVSFVLTTMVFCPQQTLAGSVPNDQLLTELMMEYQGENLLMIGRTFGSDTKSPLSFSSTVDVAGMSFSFLLNPASTYLGQSIMLSGSGIFNNITNLYDLSSLGSLGAFSWTSLGSDVVTLTAAAFQDKSKEDFKDKDGNKFMDVHDDKKFDAGTGKSTVTTQLTKADGSDDGKPDTGRDKLDKNGNWVLILNETQFGYDVVSAGTTTPGGGPGEFVSSVVATPEPSTLALFGTILGFLGHERRRRKALPRSSN